MPNLTNSSSLYDEHIPSELLTTQQWFASVITRPLVEGAQIDPLSPTGQDITEEARLFITPNQRLTSAKRIEIYNQQYWFRLLNVLHDDYPLLIRLFGYYDFNQVIGIPYLLKYHPNHWSLNTLGSRLPQWIEEEYNNSDKSLILNAARIETGYNDNFVAKEYPPLTKKDLDAQNLESLLTLPLRLQPHISLFVMDYDFFRFREAMLEQEVEYWIENDFPPLTKERTYYFSLFRDIHNQMTWEELEEAEYYLLSLFSEGSTIHDACESLEKRTPNLAEEAADKISDWFQTWAMRRWMYAI